VFAVGVIGFPVGVQPPQLPRQFLPCPKDPPPIYTTCHAVQEALRIYLDERYIKDYVVFDYITNQRVTVE